MPEAGRGQHQKLLADKDVQRWYDNLARGAKATADNYLRILGRFLALNMLTPHAFVALKPKQRDDVVSDHITQLLKEGKAGSTAAVVKKAILSWLDWNGQKLGRKIKIPGVGLRPSLKNAHIPTQDELRRVLNLADGRSRTAIAFIAYAGCRPEVLGDYTGHDGLRFKHMPDAKIDKDGLIFETVPARIEVPAELSKTGKPYFTFFGPEGCDYLQAYVHQRLEAGERITADSPVIRGRNPEKPCLRSLKISDMIRKPMRAAGLQEPPYIWRSYFSSRAMLAEARGLTHSYRDFFMGHAGDMDAVYSLHKRLPKDTIEQMRKAYGTALSDLETRGEQRGAGDARLIRLMLRGQGVPEEEAEALQLEGKTEEEQADAIHALLRKHERGPPDAMASQPGQRIIPPHELEQAIADGWLLKLELKDGRCVMERAAPTGTPPRVASAPVTDRPALSDLLAGRRILDRIGA